MNRTRVTAARAKIHEAVDELFDALEAPEEERPNNAPKPAPRSRPRVTRPEGESDELSAAKARRFLHQNGLAQVNR